MIFDMIFDVNSCCFTQFDASQKTQKLRINAGFFSIYAEFVIGGGEESRTLIKFSIYQHFKP